MFIYYAKNGNDIKFVSDKKERTSLSYIEKELSFEEKEKLNSNKYDKKVIDNNLVFLLKEKEADLIDIDNIKDINDVKKFLKKLLK
ncbi:hypothetical protein M0R04_12895 [Candidatus Dojkabacteria bacterium]|jgi:hypothetical protein|nr:hypothetical protein [Candidatus Dojkabacteria bacterium]